MSDCGNGGESCCTTLAVAGGTYDRTYAPGGDGAAGSDPATVSTFRLDKYEVTVGRFRQFVSAWNAGWSPPAGSGKHVHLNAGQGLADSASPGSFESGWKVTDDGAVTPTASALQCASQFAWTVSRGANERLPIDCVNWYEAYAFCIWDGGFLPSEAEWEYAAAGGDAQNEYPWGNTPPGTANTYAIYGCYYPNGSGNCGAALPIAPVGTPTSGAGRWGQLDLAGNVWEWALDWDSAYVDPCVDCAFLAGGSAKRYRGGSAYDVPARLVPTYRNGDPPTTKRDPSLGFRCARTPS